MAGNKNRYATLSIEVMHKPASFLSSFCRNYINSFTCSLEGIGDVPNSQG